MHLSQENIDSIIAICSLHKVKSLFAFGSVTRADFKNTSDIDFVVDFNESDPLKYTDLYFDLKLKLENLLHRSIDLLEERSIKNPFFRKELDNTKVKIYGY